MSREGREGSRDGESALFRIDLNILARGSASCFEFARVAGGGRTTKATSWIGLEGVGG